VTSQDAIDGPEAFAARFAISRETAGKFETYARLLQQWQKTINLVAPGTLDAIWSRHFADSAQLVSLAPPGVRTWLDLGSGAGFPGLVSALMLQDRGEKTRVTLIESDTRKAAFLREVARTVSVPVDIVGGRIESPATQAKVGKVEIVSARAWAPLDRLLDFAYPYFSNNSIGLFLKGREVEAEVEAAQRGWSLGLELKPSATSAEGRIAVIRNLRAKSEGRT
jgi:16S rRNA (guanine527-N7)-methyltransferase